MRRDSLSAKLKLCTPKQLLRKTAKKETELSLNRMEVSIRDAKVLRNSFVISHPSTVSQNRASSIKNSKATKTINLGNIYSQSLQNRFRASRIGMTGSG